LAACQTGAPGTAIAFDLQREDWIALIEAGSHHLVTPALAWSLAGAATIPEDVAGYFEAALTLNAGRNAILLDVLASVLENLNACGIVPVLLKGAAAQVEELYPHSGARVVGDLDLLVPSDRAGDALQCARAAGFADANLSVWDEGRSHHLPTHVDAKSGAGLELHLHVVPPHLARLVPTAGFHAAAAPCAFRGLSALIAHPTDRVAHNITHSQITDGLYRRGTASARHLFELALLCARHRAAIDWDELAHRFARTGYGPVLASTLTLANALFGHPQPLPIAMDPDALRRLERAVDRPSRQAWGLFVFSAERFLEDVRAKPRRLLRLARPSTWAQRLANLRNTLAGPKW
jgi:hypothetical protein